MSLKVLCDENLPEAVAASLKERGFDVIKTVPGTPDPEVAAEARRQERIIITFDSDFANILKYPPQDFFGIVRINIHPQFFTTVINALENLFSQLKTPDEFKGRLIIVEPTTFRIWEEE